MLTDIDYHTNPLLLIVLSMVAGALFGLLGEARQRTRQEGLTT
jgi:hypothetical protein